MAEISLKLNDKITGPLGKVASALNKVRAEQDKVTKASEKAAQKEIKAAEQVAKAKIKASQEAAAAQQASLSELGGMFTKIAEYGAAAGVAIASIAFELGKMGIEAVQSREKIEAHFTLLSKGSKAAGAAITAQLDKMQDEFNMTRKELAPLAEKLLEMGVKSGPALEKAMKAFVVASELPGGEAAFTKLNKQISKAVESSGKIEFAKMIPAIEATGANIEEVKKALGLTGKEFTKAQVDAKALGDAIQDSIIKNGTDVLLAKKGDLGAMWRVAKSEMADAIGKGLKPMIPMIQKMFAEFKKGFPYIHYGFGKVLNIGLRTAIFIKGHWSKIKPVLKAIGEGLILVGIMTAVVAAVAVVAIGMILAILGAVVAVVGMIPDAVSYVGSAFSSAFHRAGSAVKNAWAKMKGFAGHVATMVSDAVSALGDLISGAATAAANFIAGLVQGIKNGAGAVVGAVKGIASSALSAFSHGIDAHSPSRKMMEMGGHMTSGLEIGLERGGGTVHRASAGMAQKAMDGASAGASSASKGGSRSVEVNLAPGAIVIQAADGSVQAVMAALEEGVALMFERTAATQGL